MADTVKPQSAKLFDHDSKSWVEVPSSEVTEKVASGRYTFEDGIRVPVVAPDGAVGSIPASEAHEAFKEGFSWSTPEAQTAFVEKQQQQIQRDNFGDMPLTAALAGAARSATLGGSDVLLAAGGLGDAAAAVKEENPVASFVGEAAPIVAGLGAAGVGVKAGVAAGAATSARLGAANAGKIAQAIIPKAVQGAAEGAYFGVGQGISETALGDPEDVVDNLVSNVGMGALFGGGVGAVFGAGGAARPYFDELIEKGTTGFKSVVDKVAKAGATKGAVAVLNARGMKDLAEKVPEVFGDQDFMRLASAKGTKAVKEAVEKVKPEIDAARTLLKGLRSDVKAAVTELRPESQKAVADAISTASGNVFEAAKYADDSFRTIKDNFDMLLASQTKPAVYRAETLNKAVEDAIDTLGSRGPQAKQAANTIEAMQRAADLSTEGSEAMFLFNGKNTLERLSKNLQGEAKKAVEALKGQFDDSLRKHPNDLINKTYQAVDSYGAAQKRLRDIVDHALTKTIGDEKVYEQGKALRSLMNPAYRNTMEAALQNFDQLAPEFQQYAQGLTKLKDRLAIRDAVEAKLKGMDSHVDGDRVLDLFDLLGKPKGDLTKKLQQIKDLTVAMAQDTPVNKAIAVKKALGQPVTDDLKQIAAFEKKFRVMEELSKVEAPGISPTRMAMGGMIGDVAGALLGFKKTDVGRYGDVLGQIYRATDQGAKLVNTAVKGASKALTSNRAYRTAQGIQAAVDKQPIKKKRKSFQELKKSLPILASQPQALRADVTPNIAKALTQRQQQIAQFLNNKLPQDPFEATSLSLIDTGYEPSDQELSSFYRYVKAAENPVSVLNSIQSGAVSLEEVETLKTLYPRIYQTLQNTVLDDIISNGPKLSYQQRIQLGTLFDIPTDYSLQPDFIASMQASINKDEGGRPEGTGGNRKIEIELNPNETLATSSQRTTYKQ